ncbi:transporter [Alkalimarinus sediminis]|uniref:Transporter n=1 Tax=Alkalimarinus sediminis TaxID=1632866 RepID=A0A9E8HL86_9ALTE|nr:transporter [Alkalimarinus sediminis]UZW76187.1 transporter [Alkalimarinus sediminis]
MSIERIGGILLLGLFGFSSSVQSNEEVDSASQPAPAVKSKGSGEGEGRRLNEIVTVFEDRGILTSEGVFVIEPSFSYAHSTSTVVAIEGFTVIPSLIVGLINISQAQRDIFNASLSVRYGISSYLEVGVKVPYVQIDESIREREVLKGTPIDVINDASGSGLGDVELSIGYQLNDGLDGYPYFVSNLRIKSDTGKSPFETSRRQLKNEDGDVIGVVFDEKATGSGFWSVQPGITAMYPSDPAVLYGSVSYLWNLEDDKGVENGGVIDPGDAIGFSFGIGFSVNEKTSFSLGYDHNIILNTKIENSPDLSDSTFDRFHSGSFLVGISQAVAKSTSVNLSLSIGVTEYAPDMQLTLRAPFAI